MSAAIEHEYGTTNYTAFCEHHDWRGRTFGVSTTDSAPRYWALESARLHDRRWHFGRWLFTSWRDIPEYATLKYTVSTSGFANP